jgi:hypothetical protein
VSGLSLPVQSISVLHKNHRPHSSHVGSVVAVRVNGVRIEDKDVLHFQLSKLRRHLRDEQRAKRRS